VEQKRKKLVAVGTVTVITLMVNIITKKVKMVIELEIVKAMRRLLQWVKKVSNGRR